MTAWRTDMENALLVRYGKRGFLDQRQVDAGERLARDWHEARMEPAIMDAYQAWVTSGSDAAQQADRYNARRRVARAIEAVGRVAANEVVAACCRDRAVGGGAAMEILRRGLNVLADHYGL